MVSAAKVSHKVRLKLVASVHLLDLIVEATEVILYIKKYSFQTWSYFMLWKTKTKSSDEGDFTPLLVFP